MKASVLFYILIVILLILGQSSHAQTNLKGSGEVFYYHTFDWGNPDDPKGWTADEGFYFEDPQDKGLNWHWYPNDSLIARYTKEPPFRSSSSEDGHLCLFLDAYDVWLGSDTAVSTVNNSVVFPDIDCSNRSSVIVRFETNFLAFGDANGMEMYISNNYGMHWAIWKLGFGCGHREYPNGVAPGEAAIFETNITDVASGMPSVRIKIKWRNTRNYYWLIDDFELAEALDNDLRMLQYSLEWDDMDDNTEDSYIHNIPISQLGGAYTNFESVLINFGEFDQYDSYLDIDISKNHQSIWQRTTQPEWMPTSMVDTFKVVESFKPTEFGHYKIKYELNQEEEDQTPEDNYAEVFFNVTDSIYSRCDNTSEESFSLGYFEPGLEGEANEQIFIGSVFPIFGDTKINSVSVYVTGGLADGQIEFRGVLLKLRPKEEDYYGQDPIEWLVSEIVELDSSMLNTWVRLPFEKDGQSEFLYAGDIFYVGVQYWNWHTEMYPYRKHQNFAIGSDVGVQIKNPFTCYQSPFSGYYIRNESVGSKKNLMIRINLEDNSNIIDGIPEVTAISRLEQNYPNPLVDYTDIAYELAVPSMVKVDINDISGHTLMTILKGKKQAGRHTIRVNTGNFESGIYFYTLSAGEFVRTKRMIVAK